VPDEARLDLNPGVLERRSVSVDTCAAAPHSCWAADDPDPSVSELEEVAGRGEAAAPVRGPDGRDLTGRFAIGTVELVEDEVDPSGRRWNGSYGVAGSGACR
jgi:hypothetical protein